MGLMRLCRRPFFARWLGGWVRGTAAAKAVLATHKGGRIARERGKG